VCNSAPLYALWGVLLGPALNINRSACDIGARSAVRMKIGGWDTIKFKVFRELIFAWAGCTFS